MFIAWSPKQHCHNTFHAQEATAYPKRYPHAMAEKPNNWKIQTQIVQSGRDHFTSGAPLNPPITLTTGYIDGTNRGYARATNPSWDAAESTIGKLENGQALIFSSGIAAFSAAIELVPVGGKVVMGDVGYNGIDRRLKDLSESKRIKLVQVLTPNLEQMLHEAKDADLVWIETPTNPTMHVWDIAAICTATNAITVVDNTVIGFLGQSPLDLGATISMHSATKQMSGHSDLLAGALITRDEQVFEKLHGIRTLTGGVSSAFDSYLLLRGLRTLHLRQERSSQNALEIAQRLEKHPKVSQVNYPGLATHPQSDLIAKQMTGFGSLISIEIIGGVDDADQVCSRTAIWSHSTSLGGVESQLERRRKWPNEPVKVPENLIRLSVGIEDVEDLWLDLDQALNSI